MPGPSPPVMHMSEYTPWGANSPHQPISTGNTEWSRLTFQLQLITIDSLPSEYVTSAISFSGLGDCFYIGSITQLSGTKDHEMKS